MKSIFFSQFSSVSLSLLKAKTTGIIPPTFALLPVVALSAALLFAVPMLSQTNTFPSTGDVGVGTTAPISLYTGYTTTQIYPMVNIMDGLGVAGGYVMDNFGNDCSSCGGGYHGRYANGTYASPSNVLSGERLGSFATAGYVGAAGNNDGYVNATNIAGWVGTGTISSTSLPGYLTFETEPSGAVARSERMRIDQNGNVGIGTTAPAYKLQVAGVVAGSGAYVNTSDIRYKKNVEPISYGLAAVMKLRPIAFNWKDQDQDWKKQHQIGLAAQEVEEIIPEVVTTGDDGIHTKSIAYGSLVPVLIRAIQEQQKEIEHLTSQISTIRATMPTTQEAVLSIKK